MNFKVNPATNRTICPDFTKLHLHPIGSDIEVEIPAKQLNMSHGPKPHNFLIDVFELREYSAVNPTGEYRVIVRATKWTHFHSAWMFQKYDASGAVAQGRTIKPWLLGAMVIRNQPNID